MKNVKKSSGNVFEDLQVTKPAEALAKAELARQIVNIIKERGLTQTKAAKILGIDDRVGTLEVGKDGDVALYDGDPFEYTSHCLGVVINGEVVSDEPH